MCLILIETHFYAGTSRFDLEIDHWEGNGNVLGIALSVHTLGTFFWDHVHGVGLRGKVEVPIFGGWGEVVVVGLLIHVYRIVPGVGVARVIPNVSDVKPIEAGLVFLESGFRHDVYTLRVRSSRVDSQRHLFDQLVSPLGVFVVPKACIACSAPRISD